MAFVFVQSGEEAIPLHVNQYGDALSGTPGAGQPILMSALNNAGLYALTVRNQDNINGRALDVQKNDGSGSWLQIDKRGNVAQGLVLVQQAPPPAPGSGYSTIYATPSGDIQVIHGSGAPRPLAQTNAADLFLLMGA